MKSKNILIFGAGSIGSYLAAKIHASEYQVDVIGRKAEKIGNYLYINNEKFEFPTVSTEIDTNKTYDFLFLTSKMFDLKNNMTYLSEIGLQSKTIVLMQNCFFDISEYKKIYNQNITSILVYDGFDLIGNKLTHTKGAGFFIEENKSSDNLYSLLKSSNIEINKIDDIILKRAEKTIYNCSTNIFSAIYSKSLKELFEDDLLVQRIKNVFYESYEILSNKVKILDDRKSLWNKFSKLVKNMNHYASTYQDVKMNKITEISFLNGFIIELGHKIGIETPYNTEIVNEFKTKYPKLY